MRLKSHVRHSIFVYRGFAPVHFYLLIVFETDSRNPPVRWLEHYSPTRGLSITASSHNFMQRGRIDSTGCAYGRASPTGGTGCKNNGNRRRQIYRGCFIDSICAAGREGITVRGRGKRNGRKGGRTTRARTQEASSPWISYNQCAYACMGMCRIQRKRSGVQRSGDESFAWATKTTAP